MADAAKPDPVFVDLNPDDQHPTVIESLCMNCEENGETKLMLTKIPHYKEVIIMSFFCEHCGFQNNEIQSGGKIQEQGIVFKVKVTSTEDLSRQVIKSDYATLKVPEIDLEIPTDSQKGAISTIEGVLQRVISGLQQDQPVRRALDEDSANKIDEYTAKIEGLLTCKEPFHVVLDDPSGNSFVENPSAPQADPAATVTRYNRTKAQDHLLGLYSQEEITGEETPTTDEVKADEVLQFQTNCPECNAPAKTNMKLTDIPYFKEVIIMATVCDYCGHKTNEVKSGGGIEPKGKRITLNVTDPEMDLSRDVLKSEACNISIPELDLEMGGYALGGRFTTLEGLLRNIQDQIAENPLLGGGDSTEETVAERMRVFQARLNDLIEGKMKFTFIMSDPTGNSYLQNVYAPDEDPEMKEEIFERTWEQNEELGLNDMKVENYENDKS